MEHVDLSAARRRVSEWLDEHPGGQLKDMATDLKGFYQKDQQEEMAVVMQGMMAAASPKLPETAGDRW